MLMSSNCRTLVRLQQQVRNISGSSTARLSATKSPATSPKKNDATAVDTSAQHQASSMDKRFLVWSGKYKNINEVPDFVHKESMERANNRVRIRGANIMMLLTAIGCVVMVVSGKKAAESGDSVQKQNLDWHKQYNSDAAGVKGK